MTRETPSQAEYYDLTPAELDILYIITWWYNGKPLTIRDETKRLATHHEPPLKDLFRGWDNNTYNHDDAHTRLLDRGFLSEDWLCRRKIDWLLTEKGLQAARDVFTPRATDFQPRWADEHHTGPLYGDPHELLHHRKGVEAAAHKLQTLPWVNTITYYPTPYTGDGEVGDLRVRTTDRKATWRVEVLTATNNTTHWINKWTQFCDCQNTWWLFDSRSTMGQFFNRIDENTDYTLNNPITKPYKNWAPTAINKKLWRSNHNPTNKGHHAANLTHTITATLEADPAQVATWFDNYYS